MDRKYISGFARELLRSMKPATRRGVKNEVARWKFVSKELRPVGSRLKNKKVRWQTFRGEEDPDRLNRQWIYGIESMPHVDAMEAAKIKFMESGRPKPVRQGIPGRKPPGRKRIVRTSIEDEPPRKMHSLPRKKHSLPIPLDIARGLPIENPDDFLELMGDSLQVPSTAAKVRVSKKRVIKKRGPNKWIVFLSEFRKAHPGSTIKEASIAYRQAV
jgi:hypothetical protein